MKEISVQGEKCRGLVNTNKRDFDKFKERMDKGLKKWEAALRSSFIS